MTEPFDCPDSKHDKDRCDEESCDKGRPPGRSWRQCIEDRYVLEELCDGDKEAHVEDHCYVECEDRAPDTGQLKLAPCNHGQS